MTNYVGLDVSQKTTTLCIVDGEGHRQWRGECVTSPEHIAEAVLQHQHAEGLEHAADVVRQSGHHTNQLKASTQQCAGAAARPAHAASTTNCTPSSLATFCALIGLPL